MKKKNVLEAMNQLYHPSFLYDVISHVRCVVYVVAQRRLSPE